MESALSPRHPRIREFALMAASSLTVMAGATIAPALPEIEKAFPDHPSGSLLVRLILTMPALAIAFCSPFAGSIVDRFGRKTPFLLSVLLYGAAGGSGFFLRSLEAILAGRVLLGIAVAGIMTCTTTLIGDYYTGTVRNRLVSRQSMYMGIGGIFFLLSGGMLADVGWRLPFLVYLAAYLLIPAVALTVHEPVRPRREHGLWGEEKDAKPGGIQVGFICFMAFFGMAMFYLVPVYLPFHLQESLGSGGREAGLEISIVTIFSALASSQYHRLRRRAGFVAIIAVQFLLLGTGYLIVCFADRYLLVGVGMVFSGLGTGLLMPNLNLWMLTIAPEPLRGRLVGGLTMSFFLGQFLCPILADPLVDRFRIANTYGIIGTGLLILAGILLAACSIHGAGGRRREAR